MGYKIQYKHNDKSMSRKSKKSIISNLKIDSFKYVEEINARNRKKYGPLCNQCDLYKYFCRCTVLVTL